jgi:hypothetical protein
VPEAEPLALAGEPARPGLGHQLVDGRGASVRFADEQRGEERDEEGEERRG